MKVIGSICFPDDTAKHMEVLRNLIAYYIEVEGLAGDALVDILIEDDRLVIDVSKGFHCLSIPLEKIKAIINEG